jgi:colanic acid/amylovoran biosynthesis protein
LHLFEMVDGDKYIGRLRLIESKCTSSEAKGIIGQCDMYISGRLHAGVAALSQAIPTVLLAYGHKHHGFARLLYHEKYAYGGKDPEELKSLVRDAWENREEIAGVLCERMVRVRELVNLNFKIVKEIVDLDEEESNHIPTEKSASWVEMGF